jgi:hypothetical protein
MKGIYFKPRVGKNYEDSFLKILVLGESVYYVNGEKPGKRWAIEHIDGIIEHKWSSSFGTAIQDIV